MRTTRIAAISGALALLTLAGIAFAGNGSRNYRAHLSGANEVPAVQTNAQGQAVFQLSKDGQTLSYKLIVASIENVRMAHIPIAPESANGPVAAWLYPSAPPMALIPGRFDGVLAEGTLTSANLVDPLAGRPLSDLISAIEAGSAYVNVHTNQAPGGEIRGQIK